MITHPRWPAESPVPGASPLSATVSSSLFSRARWLVPVCLAGLLVSSCGQRDRPEPTAPPAAAPTNAPAQTEAKPAFKAILGKWQRPDGGYVLALTEVTGEGKLTAAYFNPNPIQVSRARVFEKEGATRVFVELNDTGYPGCTYTLAYDAKNDQLFGEYFQAAQQQTYDVAFARLKEDAP